MTPAWQLLLGLLLAVLIAVAAYRIGALNRSGALAAAVLGTIVFGLGGLGTAVLLVAFFVTSSLLSRFARRSRQARLLEQVYAKGSRRDAGQVLANGGAAGLFTLIGWAAGGPAWAFAAAAGSLAAANADTWATELGAFSAAPPRLITSGRRVEAGTSGAVSPAGLLTAAAGALLIGLLAAVFWPGGSGGMTALALVTLAGLAGSLIDSLLGASLQAIYYCPACQKETERHPLHGCGTPTRRVRGLHWLTNDLVNAACTLSAAVLAAGLTLLLPIRDAELPVAGPPIAVSSPAFAASSVLPAEFTCDGADISPPLDWAVLPEGTRSLVLVVDDPDVPGGTFTHWLLYNLPPELNSIPAGYAPAGQAAEGRNNFGSSGYRGPCPPFGQSHRYRFHVYALDLPPDLPAGLDRAGLLRRIEGRILASGELTASYQRAR